MDRIYYFTGTGNSMRAAEKIARHLGGTEIVSMRNDPLDVPATGCDMVGFVYPVYHWTMPEPVVRFVENLSLDTDAYIFVVAMPSFVVGNACEKLEELLLKKGAGLSYGEKVSSVANYALVYPPMPPPKLVVPRTERRLAAIAEEIKKRKSRPFPRAGAFIRKRYPKVMPQYNDGTSRQKKALS